MPELPDIQAYRLALTQRLLNEPLRRVRVLSPFVLRTFEPPIESLVGRCVTGVERLGKRIVLKFGAVAASGDMEHALGERARGAGEPTARLAAGAPAEPELFLVVHLMIAGRLRWLGSDARLPGRITLAVLTFDHGKLVLVESSQKKRAGLHVVASAAALRDHDPGGLDPLACSFEEFAARLRRENRTLKRGLTDPRVLDGIGNAYSDEILHAARLSPLAQTRTLSDDAMRQLFEATREILGCWIAALEQRFGRKFPGPGEITAFRPEFAVHGKFEQPCPVCGAPVQRIRYAEHETNYCAGCQTNGRILADRSLSRLLKDDWPRTVDDVS